MSTAPNTRELQLQHLACGYENTQRLIQFQDIKASAMIGLSTLVTGFTALTASWSIERVGDWNGTMVRGGLDAISDHPFLITSTIALGVFSLFASAMTLWFCISCIRPRGASTAHFQPYILFPAHKTEEEKTKLDDELSTFIKLNEEQFNEVQESRLLEYRRQIIQVGKILGLKISRLRWSGIWFLVQTVSLALFLGSFGLVLFVILKEPSVLPP